MLHFYYICLYLELCIRLYSFNVDQIEKASIAEIEGITGTFTWHVVCIEMVQ